MKVEKIKIAEGWVKGRDREANGVVTVNGVEYKFELETDDGITSIWISKEDNEIWYNRSWVPASLESDEDLDMYDISADDGIAIYEEILDFVDENGYGIDLIQF